MHHNVNEYQKIWKQYKPIEKPMLIPLKSFNSGLQLHSNVIFFRETQHALGIEHTHNRVSSIMDV